MSGAAARLGDTAQPLHLVLVQRALNGCVALDEAARGRLQAMEGQALAVDVRGLRRQYSVRVRAGRLELHGGLLPDVHASVRGAPLALWSMVTSDGVRALFGGEVEIAGDAAVAKRFKRLFDTLDIDWEEQLSHLVGDYPARRAMRVLGALRRWQNRSRAVLGEDIGDYLTEEQALLGNANQIGDLHDAVDELRDDVARLSARVSRCERDMNDA